MAKPSLVASVVRREMLVLQPRSGLLSHEAVAALPCYQIFVIAATVRSPRLVWNRFLQTTRGID
jgi:hypothetical protein